MTFNLAHGIEPKSIVKGIQDIMEGARASRGTKSSRSAGRDPRKSTRGQPMAPAQLAAEIARLEKAMYRHARELEFEEAARLRDEIEELRRNMLDASEAPVDRAHGY
jgi:excinuclease ABC subunit B